MKRINNEAVRTTDVSGLSKFTTYEFQVLAFTSVGDGPNSTVKSKTTKEDGKKLALIICKFYFLILNCLALLLRGTMFVRWSKI